MNHIPNGHTLVYHINGDTLDNRLENLKIIPRAALIVMINIKAGNDGLRYSEKRKTWISSYYDNGKHVKKTFSSKKYGGLEASNLAKKFREDATNNLDSYKIANDLLNKSS